MQQNVSIFGTSDHRIVGINQMRLKGPILPYDFRAKVGIFQSQMSTGPIGIRNEKGLPEDI
jgi:hypothetical protein